MPQDSPPIMQGTNFQLCKMPSVGSYNYFTMSKACASVGGIVVRGCVSSLLGSYVHQKQFLYYYVNDTNWFCWSRNESLLL